MSFRRAPRRGKLRIVRGNRAPRSRLAALRARVELAAPIASLVIPGLGQLLQGRRRAGVCHFLAAVGFYLLWTRHPWLPTASLLACTVWSVADAVRFERTTRRAAIRLVA